MTPNDNHIFQEWLHHPSVIIFLDISWTRNASVAAALAMCILVVALQCHPAFPFICAHNRDEERDRPTLEDGAWKQWLCMNAFEPTCYLCLHHVCWSTAIISVFYLWFIGFAFVFFRVCWCRLVLLDSGWGIEPDSGLLCGRDAQAGGFVLGLHVQRGYFAALTNCRCRAARRWMGMDGQRFSVVPSGYNKQKAIEHGHRNSWFIH